MSAPPSSLVCCESTILSISPFREAPLLFASIEMQHCLSSICQHTSCASGDFNTNDLRLKILDAHAARLHSSISLLAERENFPEEREMEMEIVRIPVEELCVA